MIFYKWTNSNVLDHTLGGQIQECNGALAPPLASILRATFLGIFVPKLLILLPPAKLANSFQLSFKVAVPFNVLIFLQHGACANVADLWKFTPLHEAAAKGKFEICKLLLKV